MLCEIKSQILSVARRLLFETNVCIGTVETDCIGTISRGQEQQQQRVFFGNTCNTASRWTFAGWVGGGGDVHMNKFVLPRPSL